MDDILANVDNLKNQFKDLTKQYFLRGIDEKFTFLFKMCNVFNNSKVLPIPTLIFH